MINGVWRGDVEATPALNAERMIDVGAFRDRVSADGSSAFPAEASRYHLHEAYRASRPDYTGKVTVPVLWDRRDRRIVNNESLDIAKMFNRTFDHLGGDHEVDLYPESSRDDIDALNVRIARSLAKGVYEVAGAEGQAGCR